MIKFNIENKDYIFEQARKANTYRELLKLLGYSSKDCKPKLEKFLLEHNFDTSHLVNAKLVGKIQIIDKNKDIILEKAKKFNQMKDLCVSLGWSKKGHKNQEVANFLEKHCPEVLSQYKFFNNNFSGIKFIESNKDKIFNIAQECNTYIEILTK